MNNVNTNIPSFRGKLELTRIADEAINNSISALNGKNRDKVLENYDLLIRSIINSDFDVFVSKDAKNRLTANVTRHNENQTIATSTDTLPLLKMFSNPVKFIEKAFNAAKSGK